jgi:hypothetical protein
MSSQSDSRSVGCYRHWPASARPVHDDRHSNQCDGRTGDVRQVGPNTIHRPCPSKRQRDKRTTVRRVHATTVRRLIGRDDTVQKECDRAGQAEDRAAALSPELPDEPAAADLIDAKYSVVADKLLAYGVYVPADDNTTIGYVTLVPMSLGGSEGSGSLRSGISCRSRPRRQIATISTASLRSTRSTRTAAPRISAANGTVRWLGYLPF